MAELLSIAGNRLPPAVGTAHPFACVALRMPNKQKAGERIRYYQRLDINIKYASGEVKLYGFVQTDIKQ